MSLAVHADRPQDTLLEALYRSHYEPLCHYARRKGAVKGDEGEIVQEAFLRLARYGAREKITSDAAFLRTIIVNIIRDRFRRRQVAPVMIEYDEMETDIAAEAVSQDDQLHYKQALKLTLADLSDLPELTKQVFICYRLRGYTYSKIADDLDISIALVRRHLRDAIVHITQKRKHRGEAD